MTTTQIKPAMLDDFREARECPKCGASSTSVPQFTRAYARVFEFGDDACERSISFRTPNGAHISTTLDAVDHDATGAILHTCVTCAYAFITRTKDESRNTAGASMSAAEAMTYIREQQPRRSAGEHMRERIEAQRWRKLLWYLATDNETRLKLARSLAFAVDMPPDTKLQTLVDAIDDGKELS